MNFRLSFAGSKWIRVPAPVLYEDRVVLIKERECVTDLPRRNFEDLVLEPIRLGQPRLAFLHLDRDQQIIDPNHMVREFGPPSGTLNLFEANENSGKKSVLATEAMRFSRLIAVDLSGDLLRGGRTSSPDACRCSLRDRGALRIDRTRSCRVMACPRTRSGIPSASA